jgi:hypothetical protein
MFYLIVRSMSWFDLGNEISIATTLLMAFSQTILKLDVVWFLAMNQIHFKENLKTVSISVRKWITHALRIYDSLNER